MTKRSYQHFFNGTQIFKLLLVETVLVVETFILLLGILPRASIGNNFSDTLGISIFKSMILKSRHNYDVSDNVMI